MKQSNQFKLDCAKKEEVIGIEVYFCARWVYLAVRRSTCKMNFSRGKKGSTSLKEIIYREKRKDITEGVVPSTGFFRIYGRNISRAMISGFNKIPYSTTEEGSISLMIPKVTNIENEFTVEFAKDFEERDRFIMEDLVSGLPGFISFDDRIPRTIKKQSTPSQSRLTVYPYNIYWNTGSPTEQMVVQRKAENK